MPEDTRTNIARWYDAALAQLDQANSDALKAAQLIRARQKAGDYPAHFDASIMNLLTKLSVYPEAFLINVRGAGGAPSSRYPLGGQPVIDGRDLPVADTQALAEALTTRLRLFDELRANHHKLDKAEAADRPVPTALPSV